MNKYITLMLLLACGTSHASINALTSCEGKKVGDVCSQGSAHGETLNDRPLKADLNYTITLLNDGYSSGNMSINIHFTVTRLEDPTDVYHDSGNIAVEGTSHVCGFHRPPCNMITASNNFLMNRTYGTRTFENGTFDIQIGGNGGSEYTQMLQEIDLLIPGQTYAIKVSL